MAEDDTSVTQVGLINEGGTPAIPQAPVLSKELSALEAAHSIEVLLFIQENEGCGKTIVYEALSRSTSIQFRIKALESAGLILVSKEANSRTSNLYLTNSGRHLAGLLRGYDIGTYTSDSHGHADIGYHRSFDGGQDPFKT